MKRGVLSVLVLSFCTVSGIGQSSITSDFDDLFDKAFVEGDPGGSVLVKKGDKIIYTKSYGVSDIKTKAAITENTIFNTGSISKTFVANGILILQERGLLSLDDDIYKYFDDFDNASLARSVTIRHLLSHTSGLPDLRNVAGNKEFYLTAKDIENFEPIKRATKLNFSPGAQFQYSNPAYNGLALIIEQVTGEPWQQFIKREIFKPAGMKDSRITDGNLPGKDVAHAYAMQKGIYAEDDYGEFPTFAAAGNGGIWCSTLDLVKYEEALRKNLFLSEAMTQESRTIYRPKNWSDTAQPFLGYGWFIEDKDAFRVKRVYHTGSQGGFRAFFISIPEKDIIYIGLFNRPVKELSAFMEEGVRIMQMNHWFENTD